jgi:hypothetical protein
MRYDEINGERKGERHLSHANEAVRDTLAARNT